MSHEDPIVVSRGGVTIEVDPTYGRLVRIANPERGIELIREPRLAENFRLLVPLPDLRGHYLYGRDQPLADLTTTEEHVTLVWRELRSDRGRFDIVVRQRIEITDAGDVVFRTDVDNRTDLTIEEVHGITLGGLGCAPGERDRWKLHYANPVGQGQEWRVFDEFPGSYLGPERPVWIGAYPGNLSMLWVDLYDGPGRRGVYFGNHDTEVRQSYLFAELTPCTTYTGPADQPQRWPDAEQVGDEPVGLALGWVSIPFVEAGATWSGPDVVLHVHDGTWWEAARYYRSVYDIRHPDPVERSWLSDEDAWQSTIISYPDDTIGYRFTDLPDLARTAVTAGIHVLQLDGWDVGGIDRNYPEYTPDPRLGSRAELMTAIQECRRIGVRILLFANLQWVNIETDWFHNELSRYATRDPYGNIRGGMGWQYRTVLGLQGQTIHRMIPANCSRPEYRRIILNQLPGVVELGADGIQLDKLGALGEIDFAPDNPLPRDRAVPAGIVDTLAEFVEQAKRGHPGFAVASEVHWDRVMPHVDASYSRFFSDEHLPTFGAVFPEYRQSCCVTGRWDFGLVNNCIRYGHVVNLEGDCLHGGADRMPELASYVAEVLRLRRSLAHLVWDSRLVDPVAVHGEPNAAVHMTLHESLADGRLSAVLNHFERAAQQVVVTDIAGATRARLHRPYEPAEDVVLPATFEIEPDRLVVIELVDPPGT